MSMLLIAVGKRLPDWVSNIFDEYNRRLPADYRLELLEVTPAGRNKTTNALQAMHREAQAIEKLLPAQSLRILLDEHGQQFSSIELAAAIGKWRQSGKTPCFIIGGADGIDDALRATADVTWSLSALTFPHALARVIVAEQVYRAWSINNQHPYHRE